MRTAVVLATLAAACRPPPPAQPGHTGPAAPTKLDPAAIDAWLASEVAERKLAGLAVVIVHEGATVFAKGYGTKRVGTATPIDPDTPFHIGSVGKQLTCAVVTQLADDGKLKLTDPVSKYFPNLVRAADVTLEDLGAHMSGYRDFYPLDYTDSRFDTPIEPDALIARYGGLPLDFEPRSRSSYSNTGYTILARVAEKASGTAWPQLLEQRLFKPLQMTHSAYGAPPPGAATGHESFLLGPVEPTLPEAAGWPIGAFGVWASARDLARWDLALATGTVISEQARRAMTTTHRTSDGREVPYGCGLGIRVRGGELVLQHSGEVAGFLSFNTVVPRIRAAVIVLANDGHTKVEDLHDALVTAVLDRPTDVPLIPGPVAEVAAMQLVRELQTGAVDRGRLGDDLSGYWTDKRLAEAAARLRPLGEVQVRLRRRFERGNQEATELDLVFRTKTLRARMFRAPTGKIHQFMIYED